MVDHRLRLRRRNRTTPIAQYVLALRADPRCSAVAAALAELPDEERLARLTAAVSPDDL